MHFLTDMEKVSETVVCVTTYSTAEGSLRLTSSETHISALYTPALTVLLTMVASFHSHSQSLDALRIHLYSL